jgi:hypothetical protein
MIVRRGFVIGFSLLAMMGAARAAEPSARDFLNGIYSAYKGKNAKGVSLGIMRPMRATSRRS